MGRHRRGHADCRTATATSKPGGRWPAPVRPAPRPPSTRRAGTCPGAPTPRPSATADQSRAPRGKKTAARSSPGSGSKPTPGRRPRDASAMPRFRRPHIARVAPGTKQDKPPHPIDAGILGADAVIQPANTGADLVKPFGFGGCAKGVIDGCFRVPCNL